MGTNTLHLAALLGFVQLFYVPSCRAAETNATTGVSAEGEATNSSSTNSGAPPKSTRPIAVSPPANSLPSYQIKPGFNIELAVPGFEIASPVALAFDERGRLFVAEMRDYPDRRESQPHLGRIRMFQSSKADGVLDTSTVYADDLPWPSAIACFNGGIFVAATPNILFLKDTGKDGIADVRKVVFSGFGGASKTMSPDRLLNSMSWGLDNRIHVGTAGIGGVLTTVEAGGEPLDLGENDFSFDPHTFTTTLEAGSGQSGLAFDDSGRKYLTDFDRPLRLVMLPLRYAARNPYVPPPPQFLDLMPNRPIYEFLSPDRARAGLTNGVAASLVARDLGVTWFSHARGTVIYRGNAFPASYVGNAFIPDSAAHVIHRAVLRDSGQGVIAERAPDERNTEFVISRDPLFHPTQVINGPDGALYVADFRNGGDSGRIYRIAPTGYKPPKNTTLNRTNTYELVVALAHLNGWHRETAARLLFEKQDPAAVPLLSNVVKHARAPLARLHALHALTGMGALTEAQVLIGLSDPDDRVRANAVLLSEKLFRAGLATDALWQQLKQLSGDTSPRVRYQLACTVGEVSRPDKPLVLASLLATDLFSPWTRGAVFSSLTEGGGQAWANLAASGPFRASPAGWSFLYRLGDMLGVQPHREEVIPVLALIDREVLSWPQTCSMLFSIGDGLQRNRSSLAQLDQAGRLQRFYTQALANAVDDTVFTTNRVEAIRLLGVSPYTFTDVGDVLFLLLGSGEPEILQAAALETLSRFDDPRIATNLVARWRILPQGLHEQAVNALLARKERIPITMAALVNGVIPPGSLSPAQANFLRTYPDPAISQNAQRLFGPVSLARPQVVQRFKETLRLPAVAARGRVVFVARCASCHRLNGEGWALGPDLDREKTKTRQNILSKILQPNLDLPARMAPQVAETFYAQYYVGIPADDNPTTVTLNQPNGLSVVLVRSNLRSLQAQSWSLMPEGLEQGLSTQNMADLLEYLSPAPPRQ